MPQSFNFLITTLTAADREFVKYVANLVTSLDYYDQLYLIRNGYSDLWTFVAKHSILIDSSIDLVVDHVVEAVSYRLGLE